MPVTGRRQIAADAPLRIRCPTRSPPYLQPSRSATRRSTPIHVEPGLFGAMCGTAGCRRTCRVSSRCRPRWRRRPEVSDWPVVGAPRGPPTVSSSVRLVIGVTLPCGGSVDCEHADLAPVAVELDGVRLPTVVYELTTSGTVDDRQSSTARILDVGYRPAANASTPTGTSRWCLFRDAATRPFSVPDISPGVRVPQVAMVQMAARCRPAATSVQACQNS